MAEFARSLFNFGGAFHKNQTSDQPDVQLSNEQYSNDQASFSNGCSQANSNTSNSNSQNSSMSSGTQLSTQQHFVPKTLQTSAPTTALSNGSFVYGKNSSNPLNTESVLTKAVANHQSLQRPEPSSQVEKLQNAPEIEQNTQHNYPVSNIVKSDVPSAGFVRGQLKVTIIEARNLLVTSVNSQPYVVCTFESSESVIPAPENKTGLKENGNRADDYSNGYPVMKHTDGFSRPVYKRQSSSQLTHNKTNNLGSSNPSWNHETIFDVLDSRSELNITIYDSANDDSFLGQVKVIPNLIDETKERIEWINLQPRSVGERVTGSIKVKWRFLLPMKKDYGPTDFSFLRLLGRGTFGQVYQVRKKDTSRIYAMKMLSKAAIVKKKEIAHTIGERNILVKTSTAASPFIIGLKFSFQTATDLYLVTDYMSGGELFYHLQKEGRFTEERAKFYIAELILALEHLHDNDIVYRDLKPENILLDANGHIALCDFGLSKANLTPNSTTNTFCGTTEYLAPEVLLDEFGYTKMVDFWSLGVLIFEMCCGWSPFYADNTQQMYKNIAYGKVRFPKEILSPEGRSFVKGLLNRNPKHRLGAVNDARELRAHPFFHDIDWELLRQKRIAAPFIPHLLSETDTSNFDPEFTQESTSIMNSKFMNVASTPLSPGIQANFKGFTYVDVSALNEQYNVPNSDSIPNSSRKYFQNSFIPPNSFIPGDPKLPPDEDVIEDQGYDFDDGNDMDIDGDHQMDDEFVNGRFDL